MADYTFDQFDAAQEQQRARFGETRRMTTGTGGDIVPFDPGNPPVPPQREVVPVSTGPTPLDFASESIDAVCSLYRRFPDTIVNLAGRNLLVGGRGVFGSNERNADRLLRFLCGRDDPESLPVPAQQFSGGQCPVRYQGTWALTGFEGNTPRSFNGTWGVGLTVLFGPISGFGPVQISDGRFEHRIFGRNNLGQPAQVVVFTVGGSNPATRWRTTSFTITATRFDGQPDNCGNPQPGYPPITPTFPQPTITIPEDGVERPVPVTIAPDPERPADGPPALTINLGGLEIDIDLGGITIGPQPPAPGGGAGLPVSRPLPDETGTDPEEPPPLPPQGVEYEEPEEEPERVIRGVLATVTDLSDELSIIVGTGLDPDNIFPDVGTVKFRCRVEVGSSGFTNPIRVQGLRTFVPCPWDGGAFEVLGTPRPGVTWTLTPVYDEVIVQ